jgi:hypothetical protein
MNARDSARQQGEVTELGSEKDDRTQVVRKEIDA